MSNKVIDPRTLPIERTVDSRNLSDFFYHRLAIATERTSRIASSQQLSGSLATDYGRFLDKRMKRGLNDSLLCLDQCDTGAKSKKLWKAVVLASAAMLKFYGLRVRVCVDDTLLYHDDDGMGQTVSNIRRNKILLIYER